MSSIKEWLSSIRVEEVSTPQVRTVNASSNIKDVFESLIGHNILSAPVVDSETKKVVGLVELMDIIAFLVSQLGDADLYDEIFVDKMELTHHKFTTTSIHDVISTKTISTVEKGSSLFESAELLAQGVPRVFVVNQDGTLGSLVTQSTLLGFLNKNHAHYSNLDNQTLQEIGVVREAKHSVSVEEKAIDAFRILHKEKLNALPILDEEGKLLTNISLRDLKGLKSQNYMFSKLYLPAIELLKVVRSEDLKDRVPIIAVKASDTFSSTVTRIATTRIHQLYVKNDNDVLSGILFLSDLIKKILEQ